MRMIELPLNDEKVKELKVGESVLLTGVIYTARDAAHKRLVEALERGERLPFDVEGQTIYYVGPTPKKEGEAIGSAGPTTSYRMDTYTPTLLDLGQKGMIGKGVRGQNVVDSMIKNGAVYFGAIGGAGALISKCITKAEVIAYEDLGAEAIRRLEIKDFPVIVAIDCEGNDLYKLGRKMYLQEGK
ncbi:MAG: Fe-S-containing hydro-lyase [Sarcina sp.]